MSDDIHSALKSIGLNDREIAVYLGLLPIGSAPASILARRTGISRSTVQFTCQELRKKGILFVVRKGPTNLFSAEPPEKLLFLLRSEREQLKQKENQVQRILGRLKALIDPQVVLPRVEFFEGVSGIASAYDKVLTDVQVGGGELLSLAQPLLSLKDPPGDIEDTVNAFAKERAKRGIRTRMIVPRFPGIHRFGALDEQDLRETRVLEKSHFPESPTQILIYGAKICSVTLEHGVIFGTIAENASITQVHRAMFEAMWLHAVPIGKNGCIAPQNA